MEELGKLAESIAIIALGAAGEVPAAIGAVVAILFNIFGSKK